MRKHPVIAFLVLCALFVSCGKENIYEKYEVSECSPENINKAAYDYMLDWYLWYDHLPDVNPADYETLGDLLEALRYYEGDTLIDRFSYTLTKEEHENYYSGKRYGMGISYMRDDDDSIYVAMVYPGSPADKAGLHRGQKLLAMNDITVETLDENTAYNSEHRTDEDFEEKTDWNNVYNAENKGEAVKFLVLDDDKEFETTLYLDDYITKSVLASKIIKNDGVKAGYVHLKSFIQSSEEELNAVFENFKKEKIDHVILDFRYNGGGLVRIAEQLIDLILGKKGDGKEIIKILYNDKQSEYNEVYEGEILENSLDGIKKVAVIVGAGTASASEMVINSLTPFVEVSLFGKTTYGKPVGMNPLDICDQTIVPITFKYANAEDYGDFFLGMEPTCNSEDDFRHDFGDVLEDGVKNALYYFDKKKCLGSSAAGSSGKRRTIEELIPKKLKGTGRIDYTF